MNTVYSPTEIQDAFTKFTLYLTSIITSNNPERNQKAVHLASELFVKFTQNQDFAKQSYEKVRGLIHSKNNYYLLLIFDQMIKNSKVTYKLGKRDCENLFKGVWEKTWNQDRQSHKIENLKLMVKVWGHILGIKFEEGLKKWIEVTFKTKFSISSQKEAQLKQIYGVPEPPKADLKMQQLMYNMDVLDNPKISSIRSQSNAKDESLFEALGIDNL